MRFTAYIIAMLLLFTLMVVAACDGGDTDEAASGQRQMLDDDDAPIPSDDDDDDDSTDDDDTIDDDDDLVDDDDDAADDDDDSTLDPDGDEDQDGITNGQEEIDGTDPLDPSDALQWHPEIDGFPRLLAGADRWNAVKQEILDGQADQARLFSRLQYWADRALSEQPSGSFRFSPIETNGIIAQAAAFVAFVLNDSSYADKAYDAVQSTVIRFDDLPLSDYDQGTIHGGQALVDLCLAYDLLVGFDLVDSTKVADMEQTITLAAKQLFDHYIENRLSVGRFLQNNHIIKLTSGLGATAMTFNLRPEAAAWAGTSLTTVSRVLFEVQMPTGGGQAEGPNYLDYTFKTFLPFAAIYHRFSGGVSLPYKVNPRTKLFPPYRSEILYVADPFSDPRMEQILDWRMVVTMPDGQNAPIDDANTGCGYYGPIAAMFQRSDYAWVYRDSSRCRENTSSAALLELAFLHQFPQPSPPTIDTAWLGSEAGQAVLRSDWADDALFALMIGEHGTARLAGIGHEQADATSFLLYANGKMMALDPGYISFNDRWHVIQAENHNLILVDGQGPPINFYFALADSDAWLSDLADTGIFRSAKVDSRYRSTDVQRWVMLVGDDYFATAEVLDTDQPRDFTWQLHANGGGTTGGDFTLEDHGALIENGSSVMRSLLLSDGGGVQFTETVKDHGYAHGSIEQHAVLLGTVRNQNAGFLSLHLPAASVADLPEAEIISEALPMAFVVHGEDYADFLLHNRAENFQIDPGGQMAQVESDAQILWMRTDPFNGQLIDYSIIGGSYLMYGGVLVP